MDPGVAAAGRDLAGWAFRQAVDTELAAYWSAIAHYAVGREAEADTSGLVVRAGQAATPYLLRLNEWNQARKMLEKVLARDPSQAGAALPALRAIAAAMLGSDHESAAQIALTRALARIDPVAGERQMAVSLTLALDRRDYLSASEAASYLVTYWRDAGRLGEALRLVRRQAGYSRQAGLGPWTQLSDQVQRLQILNFMGQAAQVFDDVRWLGEQMDSVPATSGQPEIVIPWDVREMLLDTGRSAAVRLRRWEEALQLNAVLAASRHSRGAPDTESARARFNDYGPLLRLGRTDQAVAVLNDCRKVFEAAQDVTNLGKVLGGLADAEDKRGHSDVAVGLQRDALRYCYLAADVAAIQVSHHNLGNYFGYTGQLYPALAHHLAAALLRVITGSEGAEDSALAATADRRAAAGAALPADVAVLSARVGEVPGVHLDQLLTALPILRLWIGPCAS